MKIRAGFVSNSSSTSFTIAFKEEDFSKCPHCGRSDQSPVDLVNHGGASSLIWLATPEESDDLLKKWGKQIVECTGEINVAQYEVDHMQPPQRDDRRSSYQSPKYKLANRQEQLRNLEERTQLVQTAIGNGCTIVKIEVSDHNHTVETLLAMKEAGKIQIIDEER